MLKTTMILSLLAAHATALFRTSVAIHHVRHAPVVASVDLPPTDGSMTSVLRLSDRIKTVNQKPALKSAAAQEAMRRKAWIAKVFSRLSTESSVPLAEDVAPAKAVSDKKPIRDRFRKAAPVKAKAIQETPTNAETPAPAVSIFPADGPREGPPQSPTMPPMAAATRSLPSDATVQKQPTPVPEAPQTTASPKAASGAVQSFDWQQSWPLVLFPPLAILAIRRQRIEEAEAAADEAASEAKRLAKSAQNIAELAAESEAAAAAALTRAAELQAKARAVSGNKKPEPVGTDPVLATPAIAESASASLPVEADSTVEPNLVQADATQSTRVQTTSTPVQAAQPLEQAAESAQGQPTAQGQPVEDAPVAAVEAKVAKAGAKLAALEAQRAATMQKINEVAAGPNNSACQLHVPHALKSPPACARRYR